MIANTAWIPGAVVTGVAIGAPWSAAILLRAWRRHARIVGLIAALVSAAASALLLLAAPAGESLYEALMLLFFFWDGVARRSLSSFDRGSARLRGVRPQLCSFRALPWRSPSESFSRAAMLFPSRVSRAGVLAGWSPSGSWWLR